jgi:hypothetical protein
LIPLYEAYRAMDRGLHAVFNWPRSVGAHVPLSDEQDRIQRAEAIADKLSQLTSIKSFWTEICQEIMVSHCYWTGGDVDALRVLARASVLPVA